MLIDWTKGLPARTQTPQARVEARKAVEYWIGCQIAPYSQQTAFSAHVLRQWLLDATFQPMPDMARVFAVLELPWPTDGQLARVL